MLKHARRMGPGQRFRLAALFSLAIGCAVFLFAQALGAQESTTATTEERTPLSAAELEELAGPIALYPDDLVSIVLPASTYPLQIVQAARYLEAHENDPTLKPGENWDSSVVALLNYPEVIELMNADVDWTRELGEAAIFQQAELLDAIQSFRDRAYAAGNLESDERQVVTKHAETVVIEPADPEVIYVPYYEPREVVVYQPYPVYHYYPRAYPVYYYPYPYGYAFDSVLFWGITLAFSIDWHSHHVHVYDHYHQSHPYYGRYYHYPYYRRHSIRVSYRENIWRPRHQSRFRHQRAASVSGENRKSGATSVNRERYRTQSDPRRRASASDSGKHMSRGNTAVYRRNDPAPGMREVTRPRKQSARSAGTASARSQAGAERRTSAPTASTYARRQMRPDPPRAQPPRTSGGVRSDRSSSSRSRWSSVTTQRSRPGAGPERRAPASHGMAGYASRGTRSIEGMSNRGAPGPRRGLSERFESSARPEAGGRYRPDFDRRGNNGRRGSPNF
ncbi:MAG TPA: DUF3300 domain-containing protein [Gammaproteobacteria bacterium]|nr:DUF3300 domain-containing protein [Gammaproteobacteria bacterium]